MDRTTALLLVAGAIASAAALPARAAEAENCYGVALKGHNDCAAAHHSCAGMASVDYDGASWKAVPKGTCVTIKTPLGPGSLTEIQRPS